MRFKIYIDLCLFIFLFACQNNKAGKSENTKSDKSVVKSTEYTTKTGKKFIIHIDHSMGASICEVKIETKGFAESNAVHNLGKIDPVEEVIFTDADNNGFEEIYLFTRSAGSSSYGNIYGVGSNKNKSATPVYVRAITEKQMETGGLFEGFRGHNKFSVKEGKLINTFPVYSDGDSNAKPTGGKTQILYSLIAGEAGWILEPTQIIQ